MSLPNFKKVNFDREDRLIDKFQDNVSASLSPLLAFIFNDGILHEEVAITTAGLSFEHKLGRAPLGWVIFRKRANSVVWDTQDSNTDPSTYLDLDCSADVTVDIYIF